MKVWVLTCDYGCNDVQVKGVYATAELGMQDYQDEGWRRYEHEDGQYWATPSAHASEPIYQLNPWEVQGAGE